MSKKKKKYEKAKLKATSIYSNNQPDTIYRIISNEIRGCCKELKHASK